MTDSLQFTVAAEIRAELARQQIPQARLAEVLGLSQPQISQRLKGRIAFNVAELEKVAEALGVPVSHFMTAPAVPA